MASGASASSASLSTSSGSTSTTSSAGATEVTFAVDSLRLDNLYIAVLLGVSKRLTLNHAVGVEIPEPTILSTLYNAVALSHSGDKDQLRIGANDLCRPSTVSAETIADKLTVHYFKVPQSGRGMNAASLKLRQKLLGLATLTKCDDLSPQFDSVTSFRPCALLETLSLFSPVVHGCIPSLQERSESVAFKTTSWNELLSDAISSFSIFRLDPLAKWWHSNVNGLTPTGAHLLQQDGVVKNVAVLWSCERGPWQQELDACGTRRRSYEKRLPRLSVVLHSQAFAYENGKHGRNSLCEMTLSNELQMVLSSLESVRKDGSEALRCILCEEDFADSDEYIRHEVSQHGEEAMSICKQWVDCGRPPLCGFCDRPFGEGYCHPAKCNNESPAPFHPLYIFRHCVDGFPSKPYIDRRAPPECSARESEPVFEGDRLEASWLNLRVNCFGKPRKTQSRVDTPAWKAYVDFWSTHPTNSGLDDGQKICFYSLHRHRLTNRMGDQVRLLQRTRDLVSRNVGSCTGLRKVEIMIQEVRGLHQNAE